MFYVLSFSVDAKSHFKNIDFSSASLSDSKLGAFKNGQLSFMMSLNDIKQICNRIIQEELSGQCKFESVLLADSEKQFETGIYCDKNKIYSYYHEDGKDLVSFTHDNFDAAVSDLLSHIY